MKRILKKLPNYKRIGQAALMLLTYLLALIGAVGLAITIINPVNLWWSISPIETKLFVIKYSTVINYLEYLQLYYWYAIGAFTATFALAYIIHIRSIKQVVRGIKATPRAILYSPVTTYKELVLFRDWLFEKIEYLNSESAKWRRFFNVLKSPYSLLRSFGLSP